MKFTTAFAILAATGYCVAMPTTNLPSELRNTATPMDCVVQGDGLLCKADPTKNAKRDESSDIKSNLHKRCFHNGGGWYWCAFAAYKAPTTDAVQTEETETT